MTDKITRRGSSSSHSRTSLVKSIASSGLERKSLEWVDDMLEESSKNESRSDYTSETWARIVASELTMADVDEKIKQVEEELFGTKSKVSRDKKGGKKVKEMEEVVEEEEEEEEDGSEPRYFTFDLGRLDDHVNDIIRLLDSVTYPQAKPMPDLSMTKSVYTSTRDNMNRLGLQVILNRVAVVFEHHDIKPSRDFPTPSIKVDITSEAKSNIWDKLKTMKLSEALRTLASRTDSVFGKELGIISGSLLVYPRHALLLVEGPELSLVDYFTQLYGSNVMQRIIKGKVLFIMPQVLIRYFEEWSDMEAIPPEMKGDLSTSDPVKLKKLLKVFGNKCAHFWKYVRRNKLTGVGRTCDEVPDKLLPEEKLINLALESTSLRPLHQWLNELVNLDYKEDFADDSWPETNMTLPETSFKPDHYVESLGITVKSKNAPSGITPQMDKFLTANKKLYQQGELKPVAKAEKKEQVPKTEESRKQEEKKFPVKAIKAKSIAWKSRKKKDLTK